MGENPGKVVRAGDREHSATASVSRSRGEGGIGQHRGRPPSGPGPPLRPPGEGRISGDRRGRQEPRDRRGRQEPGDRRGRQGPGERGALQAPGDRRGQQGPGERGALTIRGKAAPPERAVRTRPRWLVEDGAAWPERVRRPCSGRDLLVPKDARSASRAVTAPVGTRWEPGVWRRLDAQVPSGSWPTGRLERKTVRRRSRAGGWVTLDRLSPLRRQGEARTAGPLRRAAPAGRGPRDHVPSPPKW